jgi:Mrp family chromosome partitioning ATPase
MRIIEIVTMADNDGWNTVSHKHKLTPRISEPEDDDGGDFVVYSPRKKKTRDATEANPLKNQCKFVLILVGIPGSGKSTFATKLENVSVLLE